MKSVYTVLFAFTFLTFFSCSRNKIHVYHDEYKKEERISLTIFKNAKKVKEGSILTPNYMSFFGTTLVFEKNGKDRAEAPVMFVRVNYALDNQFFLKIGKEIHEFSFGNDDVDSNIDNDDDLLQPEPGITGLELAVGAIGVVVGDEEPFINPEPYAPLPFEFAYDMDTDLKKKIMDAKDEITFRFYINRNPYEFELDGRKLKRLKRFLVF